MLHVKSIFVLKDITLKYGDQLISMQAKHTLCSFMCKYFGNDIAFCYVCIHVIVFLWGADERVL